MTHIRYMVVVGTDGCQDTEETALLGIDIKEDSSKHNVCEICDKVIRGHQSAG